MRLSNVWRAVEKAERQTCIRHMKSAPTNVGAMAKELGLRVNAATLPSGISGEIRPDTSTKAGYLIRVNAHESKNRQRFTVAHEIGHYLLHRDQIGEGLEDDILYRSKLSSKKETEANKIAADILMPRDLVEDYEVRLGHKIGEEDVPALAEIFRVSQLALMIRLGLS